MILKNNWSEVHIERVKFNRVLLKSHLSLFNKNDIFNAVEIYISMNQPALLEFTKTMKS